MNNSGRIAVTLFSLMVVIVLFSLGQHVTYNRSQSLGFKLFADAGEVSTVHDRLAVNTPATKISSHKNSE